MKKIAFIFDGSLNNRNSVRDILYNLLCQFDPSVYESVIIPYRGVLTRPYRVENIGGYKTYLVKRCSVKDLFSDTELKVSQKILYFLKDIVCKVVTKIPRIRHVYWTGEYNRFYDRILSIEEPDVVVYFTISPQKGFSKVCKKRNIPYISMLYDTYIGRPHITQKESAIEVEEIKNAAGYFVPDFFAEDYLKHYDFPNISSFKLPLLIPRDDVVEAYENVEESIGYTYFGQMQAFRNADRIKEIFERLGESLDIFSTESHPTDRTYIFHEAVSGKQLYKTVASSDFLIAFDNSEPYSHYLPSKAYLYVSFTKPIIVFGNNADSALKRFLQGYHRYYYHNIDDASLHGLIEFINQNRQQKGFDEEVYSRYTDYLPQTALHDITATIEKLASER